MPTVQSSWTPPTLRLPLEKAASAAVARAGKTLRDLRVAEIAQLDIQLDNGKIEAYRAKHGIDDPDSALGPPPADPDPEIELERTGVEHLTRTAVQAIEAIEAPALADPDHVHELAL